MPMSSTTTFILIQSRRIHQRHADTTVVISGSSVAEVRMSYLAIHERFSSPSCCSKVKSKDAPWAQSYNIKMVPKAWILKEFGGHFRVTGHGWRDSYVSLSQ